MAFRFRREGDYVKHRTKLKNSGMQPWVQDFKYRVVDWHYQFYMRNMARRAIASDQFNAERSQQYFDAQVGSLQTRKGISEEDKMILEGMDKKRVHFSDEVIRYFNWRPFIPNVVPYKANSNPFCPVSANKTGWKEAPKRRLTDPQPKAGHLIAGTDDSVPIFPKYR